MKSFTTYFKHVFTHYFLKLYKLLHQERSFVILKKTYQIFDFIRTGYPENIFFMTFVNESIDSVPKIFFKIFVKILPFPFI